MIEPKVVGKLTTGQGVYWCRKLQRQMIDHICQRKYFRRPSRNCRACLGVGKGERWPEPWASLGKEDEQINTVVVG